MKKYLLVVIALLIVPSVTFASWWNPLSWNIFSFLLHSKPQVETFATYTASTTVATSSITSTPVISPTIQTRPKKSTPVYMPTTNINIRPTTNSGYFQNPSITTSTKTYKQPVQTSSPVFQNQQTTNQDSKPSVSVLSPNGGETFKVGDDVQIRWSALNAPNIYFALTDEAGHEVITNLVHVDPNQNQAIFHLSNNIPAGTFKLKTGIFSSTDTCGDGSCSRHTFLASDLSDSAFTITKQQEVDVQPPVIRNVSGPVTVPVWAMASWNIDASDPQNQNLHYAVNWDSAHDSTGPNAMVFDLSTVKYYQYKTPGTYTAMFYVTNDDFFSKHTGLYAKYPLTIEVPNPTGSALDTATIKVTSPQSGDIWNYNMIADPRKIVSISWTASGLQGDTLAIDLISSSGERVENIVSKLESPGVFGWILDHNIPDGSYAIRIYDDIKKGGPSDTSAYFNIINSAASSTNSTP